MYTPKPRNEYIAQCRYYNGQDYTTLPKENQSMGFYEQCWVDMHFREGGVEELKNYIKDYKKFGLGSFNHEDGAPIALKALIWSRYMHWGSGYETPESFKKWWHVFYLREESIDQAFF